MKRSDIQVGQVYAKRAPRENYAGGMAVLVLSTDGYNRSYGNYAEQAPAGTTGRGILVKELGNYYEGKCKFTKDEVLQLILKGEGVFCATNNVKEPFDDYAWGYMLRGAKQIDAEFDKQKRIKKNTEVYNELLTRAQFLGLELDSDSYTAKTYGTVTVSIELMSHLLAQAAWPGLNELLDESD